MTQLLSSPQIYLAYHKVSDSATLQSTHIPLNITQRVTQLLFSQQKYLVISQKEWLIYSPVHRFTWNIQICYKQFEILRLAHALTVQWPLKSPEMHIPNLHVLPNMQVPLKYAGTAQIARYRPNLQVSAKSATTDQICRNLINLHIPPKSAGT